MRAFLKTNLLLCVIIGISLIVFEANIWLDSKETTRGHCISQETNVGLKTSPQDKTINNEEINSANFKNENVVTENPVLVLPYDCNDPLTGDGVVINDLGGGNICLLCETSNLKNLIDGDLGNYADFNMPVSLSGSTTIVSIKDILNTYPSGYRTGFVIQSGGTLLDISLYNNFQIKTFFNGALQETAIYGGGGLLEANLIAGISGAKRLSFVTNLPFDEVELIITSALTGISNLRVYYAFVDADPACDYNCQQSLSPPLFSSSVNGARTGIDGFCLFCSVSNTGNVVDADTTNFATINLPASIGAKGTVSVFSGEDLPAGYDAGVAVSDGSGLLGILSTTLLGKITINTYLNGSLQESVVASSALVNVGLLPGSENINSLGFTTTVPFDEIQVSVGGISVATNIRVYFAFIRPDADGDGVPDCIDKCDGGDDMLDADGDGQPNDCDFDCSLSSGYDISVCPDETTAQLPAPGIGESWSAVSGNPGSASVDSSGFVSNLQEGGTYFFELSNGVCSDTFQLNFNLGNLSGACNMPVVGSQVIIDSIGNTGGICLLCSASDAANLIDGNYSNYMTYNATLSLLSDQSIISLKDTLVVYPENTRTGYVVSADGGLLSADVLNKLEIKTYLNGTFQEVGAWSSLLNATALPGSNNQVRLSFVTTKTFNEIELVAKGVLGVLTNLRIYYAFTEPEIGCDTQPELGDCLKVLSANSEYAAFMDYDETGLDALACVNCLIENIGNLIDDDIDSYTTINLTVGIGASASLAVATPKVIEANHETGFVVSGEAELLDLSVLSGITIETYLNGVQQESFAGGGGLLHISLLPAGADKGFITCQPTSPFDEIKLTVSGVATALSQTKVYAAFIRSDIDGDGVPDCYDKCCGSPDSIDSDENGLVDCSDPQCVLYGTPVVTNDTFTTCPSLQFLGYLGSNDNALAFPYFSVVSQPSNGTVFIEPNGIFRYSMPNYFCGTDQFVYKVCNGNVETCCNTATVIINMIDNNPPVLENIPADITIQCDDFPPNPLQVQATDECNSISVTIDETVSFLSGPTCNSYQINRTWTAADCCMKKDSAIQVITVEDNAPPNIYHIYTLPNGKKLIAGVSDLVSTNWKEVVFPQVFNQVPVVLTQVVSNNNPSTVIVQTRKVETSYFEMRLKEQESSTGFHVGEKVSWIAVEPGSLDSINIFEVGSVDNIGSALGPFSFVQNYPEPPNLILSLQSNLGFDPVSIRVPELLGNLAQFFLQEETSKDVEISHVDEKTGYMAISPGTLMADENNAVFGESGEVQVTTNWTSVNFQNSYINPIVVAGALSFNDVEPATVRIRNVSPSGFEIRLEEWGYQDGVHAPESVSYLVVEGSIPNPPDGFCAYGQSGLPNNLIGWDNCDDFVPIAHTATPIDSNGMLYVDHHWLVTDNCGNATEYSLTAPCVGISLKLKLLLKGPLIANGGGTLMRDNLRTLDLIPDTEPYSSIASFQHIGYGGGEEMDVAIKDVHGENAIVDWVFLEIRNAANPQEIMASQSVLLRQNGYALNIEGDSVITVLGLLENDYYVAVRHRNHLGVMTGESYFLSTENPPLIDLSLPGIEVYGGESAYFLTDQYAALWPGDLNADRRAIYQGPNNDIFPILQNVITVPDNTDHLANYIHIAYANEDLNMDGKVIFQGPNNDRAMLLFNTTLAPPHNSFKYTNYIANELLP